MRKLVIELAAVLVAAGFALAILRTVSPDDNVAFFIALIGSMAIWEGARFGLVRIVPGAKR